MGDSHYTNPANWTDFQYGHIFEAVVPYVPERPGLFYKPHPTQRNTGTITSSLGNFSNASEQQMVTTLKRRKVLILSENEIVQDSTMRDITVAKIYSVKPTDRNQHWYQLLISDQHPFFIRLDSSVTGVECFVNISTVTAIGKTMMLDKKMPVPAERMTLVGQRITEYIGLGLMNKDAEDDSDSGDESSNG